MPIYMKIEGIVGPVTFNNSKGWIELLSVHFWDPTSNGVGSAGKSRTSEISVTKYVDSTSPVLFQLSADGRGVKKVTIVFVRDGCEYVRVELGNTSIVSITSAGNDWTTGSPVDLVTLNFANITFEKGSSALLCQMVRPQDWGGLKAREELNRSAKAK